MKFGKELKVKSVNSWREKYMSYKRLKRVIGKIAMQMKEAAENEEKAVLDAAASRMENGTATAATASSSPSDAQQSNESAPMLERRGSTTFTRRFSKAYGATEISESLDGVTDQEQRDMLTGDAKKEFNAIIDNDIDKVNKHFREKLSDYKAAYQRLLDAVRDTAPAAGAEQQQTANSEQAEQEEEEEFGEDSALISSTASSNTNSPTPQLVRNNNSSRGRHSTGSSRSSSRPGTPPAEPAASAPLLPSPPPSVHRRPSISLSHTKQLDTYAGRLMSLFKECCQLESYSQLNYDGFRKIMKKYDKQTGEQGNQEKMIERLESEPFMSLLSDLKILTKQVEDLFYRINLARGHSPPETLSILKTIRKEVENPVENEESDHPHIKYRYILIGIFVYFILLFVPFLPVDQERAQRCAALLSLITILWVTEAIPFFVSALCIPFFVIINGILADDKGQELDAEHAAKTAFGAMFNDTIMLILGGFSISTAFSKCGFELRLAAIIQRSFGDRPILFLLAFMLLGCFMSMWISNVAAPVLLTSLLLPIVHDFGSGSKYDRAYARALLVGLAFSCNIGGMMSPISSPQNAVSLGFLEQLAPEHSISFMEWLVVSVPFCSIGILLVWAWIYKVYLGDAAMNIPPIPPIVYEKRPLTRTDWSVCGVSLLTILLWCSLSYTRPVLGEMGTVAVIPMVIFFGSGFLTKTDLYTFKWDLILLVGGGSVLGAAVNSSRLLHIISEWIHPHLEGQPLLVTVFAVLTLVFVITTFVSHTVAALILSPLIIKIGVSAGYTQLLSMSATLMMSATMSLPTSSFPNINSLSQEDDFGRAFLHSGDFLKHGTSAATMLYVLLNVWSVTYMRVVFGPDGESSGSTHSMAHSGSNGSSNSMGPVE